MLRKLLLLRKKKNIFALLEELRKKDADFTTREKELEAAIDEVENDEDSKAVEEMVSEFENDKKEHDSQKAGLEKELEEIDSQIAEIENNEPSTNQSSSSEKGDNARSEKNVIIEREVERMGRSKYFGGLTREAIKKHTEREDVKSFIDRVVSKFSERGAKDVDILIPNVTLDLLRDNLHKYSKLINRVSLRKVRGKGRVNIVGAIPEAIWTEACGKLNELDFGFNQVEIDGYKVAGFIPICNSNLEDADIVDLYNEILFLLGQAIGYAVDKAIVYGTGKKMPLGFVTRLAQELAPENYSEKARKWENLSTKNILKVDGATSQEFFSKLITTAGVAKSNYSDGKKTWIMNEETKTKLLSKAIAFDSSGTIVANINNTMPIIGGEIEILEFMKDGDIAGGYLSTYLLGERAGATFAASEHAQFIEDNTVFKGTARYDGVPAIAEAFVLFNIDNATPTKTIEFAQDKANPGI